MGGPQGHGPTPDFDTPPIPTGGGGNKKGHGDLGSAVSAARKYASLMAEIETGLEEENRQLQAQIVGYEGAVRILSGQITSLKIALANKSDCDDEEFDAKPESPEELSKEKAPPVNEDGGPS